MPRLADHDARKKDILSAAIELYLNSAQPVSSDVLCRTRRINLSSATVRHVFFELEESGYLTHPHTSAGRVPTDEGYRFYLNVLMRKKKLKEEDVYFLTKIFDAKIRELDDLVFEVPKIMSDFTHYVSMAYLEDEDDERVNFYGMRYLLEHPEFSDVRRVHKVVEALEEMQELTDVIKRDFSGSTKVYIGKECPCARMEHCAVVVARYGRDEEREGRLALIGPKRMAYGEVLPLMDYISELFEKNIEKF